MVLDRNAWYHVCKKLWGKNNTKKNVNMNERDLTSKHKMTLD